MLVTSLDDSYVAWFENDGSGSFSSRKVLNSYLADVDEVIAVDLDADGDLEVVTSSFTGIAWFENLASNGCTDTNACNYNPNVWVEDGSCCYESCGCLDSGASNYDPNAICDNNSCYYLEGCSDPVASNYDPLVVIDDGSCEYVVGCTNELAENYDPEAGLDDGQCLFVFTGLVFHDVNQNGVFDEGELGLPYQSVLVEPLGLTVITNDLGEFSFDVVGAQTLSFSVDVNNVFPYPSTPSPVWINLNNNPPSTHLEFGLTSDLPEFAVCVDFYPSGNGFLCNDWTNHNICLRNMGNVTIDGVVEVEYDLLFQGHQEITPISFEEGNIVQMTFENLQPGQMFFYDIGLITPTADHIGEFVVSTARVTGFYEGEQVAYGEKILEMEILCAYDPNDKQAFPLGYTDDHLLLQETEQEFLVRFQNTGNAPAQDVRIQDTLDINFDIESFRLMANSHSAMTTIDPETRLIDFFFEDIQLPDSTNNEPESHGLVSYKVTPLPDLPVGTVLENTAYIYFDNNEPIITNTTWTTIHECGGEAEFVSETALVCDEVQVNFDSSYPW
ncbi:MAG: VCBS repeat-containing protein, partial [Bacteroidota bacterium]